MNRRRFRWEMVGMLTLVLFGLVVPAAEARPGRQRGWERIGEATVNDALDHDTIPVTAAQGTFKAIQIHVLGHAVQFRSVKIHFGNGDVQNVELRSVIRAGGSSRVIDVEGADRVIRSIEFLYDAQTVRGRKAIVRVLGRN